MILVELLDGSLEVRALLAFDEQLRDLGVALHVLWTHFKFSHFALPGGRPARARHRRPSVIRVIEHS